MAGVVRTVAVVVAVSLAALAPAWAQDSDLKKEVETLKKKVAALETETPAGARTGLPVSLSDDKPVVEDSPGVLQDLNKWMKDWKLSGFVDVGYTFNFGRPDNKLNGNMGLTPPYAAIPALSTTAKPEVRAFDRYSNAFYLHNAQLLLHKDATDKSVVGGRIKASFGQDADAISSNGSFGGGTVTDSNGDTSSLSGENFDITEAFVSVFVPVGRGISLTAGKFATLSGSEVIESKDNLNYSRSMLFTWAIPFTHTGIRATYSLFDQMDVTLGFNNGWDQLVDNNDSKTVELSTTFRATETLKFIGNLYYGSEKAVSSRSTGLAGQHIGDKRLLFDFVAQATFDKLTVVLNWDYAKEVDSATDASSGVLDDARWTGLALYAKYQASDLYAPGLRAEYFRDSDGFRTGTKQTLKEVTFTNQFDINSNLIFRLELRLDQSNEDVFLKKEDSKGSQFTFGAEAIVYF